MTTIIHTIRLKPGVAHERFEQWVRETDYQSCPRLPSVAQFSVHCVSTDPEAPFHYFEVIHVDNLDAFEQDMRTDTFRALVDGFSQMADVVTEITGRDIPPGWRRDGVKP